MCEPTTAVLIGGMVLTAAAGAMSAYGQIQAGNAADEAGKYQQKVADNNAKLADRSAKDAIQRGAIEEGQDRLRTRLLVGSQRAAFASRGVDLSSESVADVIATTTEVGERDALMTRSNAQREAQGFKIEGMNYKSSGALARMEGQNAKMAGKIGATGTLLGTAGSVATKWYDAGIGGSTPPAASTSGWGTKKAVWNRGY